MSEYNFPSILVLGSTGSVGSQTMAVARECGASVRGISGNRNWKLAEEQVRESGAPIAVMADEQAASELRVALADTDTKVLAGEAGIEEMIRSSDAEVAVNAILGEAGLMPSLHIIDAGMDLALANKETLVVAGDLVMDAAATKCVPIIPVDSEHCAIWQCMRAGELYEVKKLILTCSGGPFFGKSRAELEKLTLDDALSHPTWSMGAKITVDSATLMNKGFEVIEAAHLFGVPADRIDVVVHRESIIHSLVEYVDNSMMAQMSVPDMRLCVQYALSVPQRTKAIIPPLDLTALGNMTFFKPDNEAFPLLSAARRAFTAGGACPAALNAANEVAVAAFIDRKLSFTGIFDVVLRVMDEMPHAKNARTLSEILDADREARERAAAKI